ncbi:MAG TPA: hypothetical protein VFB49_13320 [Patescibacteria group bacterium]|nr:hypothetical protein [Patescibacteria group bacterium]
MKRKVKAILSVWIVLVAVLASSLATELPAGWIRAGSHPGEYDMGVDRTNRRAGRAIAFVKGKAAEFHGFGTLMQSATAGDYRGKRVRFSADVRSEKVQSGWAGLWFRIDGARPGETLGFDNMQDRPLLGTTGWKRVEIVLDVPESAVGMAFGILLTGDGEVWMDNLKFEVVQRDVTPTGFSSGPPRNLDFEK